MYDYTYILVLDLRKENTKFCILSHTFGLKFRNYKHRFMEGFYNNATLINPLQGC